MSEAAQEKPESDCAAIVERLLGTPAVLTPCPTSGNNRVFRVASGGKNYLAKWYFTSEHDKRDRLDNEWKFLEYAKTSGIGTMPEPVVRDSASHIAIYSFLEGAVPKQVTQDMVVQAAQWIVDLNRYRNSVQALALPDASESCFSADAHIALLQQRLNTLSQGKALPQFADAFQDILKQMQDAFTTYKTKLYDGYKALGLTPDQPLPKESQCLSPSDFGFHNTLISPKGRVQFIDFEYAGWDDPAKMLCDFFLHPGIPVNTAWAPVFCENLKKIDMDVDSVIARSRLLYPLLGLRWCCIILNVFVPQWAARRQFADPAWNVKHAQEMQLAKAARTLEQLQKPIF